MSNIPSKAMPHAAPAAAEEAESPSLAQRARDGAGKIADLARDNPKTAIAAGAAVAAGMVAAAAIPLARRRGASTTDTPRSGGKKKGG